VINWKKLTHAQMLELEVFVHEDEVILVDPKAHYNSPNLFLFEAQEIVSEKQLKRYKNLNAEELEEFKEKVFYVEDEEELLGE
jgi:hypothetical protein